MNDNIHIVRNPEVCGGQPTFASTRVLLRVVLAYLADGKSFDEIRAAFPSVTTEHLRAAVALAAESAS